MKYQLTAITLLAAMAGGAVAQERDAAFKAAAAHIVTAHECAKVTDDTNRKNKALEMQRDRLIAAGYEPARAETAIAEITDHLKNGETKVTAEMCNALLSMMEK